MEIKDTEGYTGIREKEKESTGKEGRGRFGQLGRKGEYMEEMEGGRGKGRES